MSSLPQRKKTPAEIAHLRESLGIPEAPPIPQPSQPEVPQETPLALPANQAPAPPDFPAGSKLPRQRHSSTELEALRRQEALTLLAQPAPHRPIAAHPAIIVAGYLAALAGTWVFQDPRVPPAALAGSVVIAWCISIFIFARRSLSRHHAAFIAVIALLVIIFGAIHLFPHLRHAT